MNPFAQYPFKTTKQKLRNRNGGQSAEDYGLFAHNRTAARRDFDHGRYSQELGKPISKVIGSGHATDTIALHDREDMNDS